MAEILPKSIPARTLTSAEASGLRDFVTNLRIASPQQDAALPALMRSLVDEIHRCIDAEGVCILEGLPIANDEITFALMALVGKPGADADEEDAGPLIMDLKPMPRDDTQKVTSYYTWNEFDFHTDLAYVDTPPDYITVVCVQPDPEGLGLSLFADIEDCIQTMPQSAIERLQQPLYSIAAPPRCITSQNNVPLLRKDANGRWRLRVRFDRVSTSSNDGQAALDALHDAFSRHRTATLLPARSAYICDNHRVVHGRTPFSFHNDGTDRHLKRIYGMRR
jgi:L-asparagine oxygenase